jgi:S1-C subfamily serine protease
VEAGPFYEGAPIYVQRPKQKSPAAQAGLQRGQVITAAADQDLKTWFDLQRVLHNAKPGDEIQLKIRQESGALDEIVILRP